MKKYSFRLQTVLDMREKKLEEKRLEMAKVITLLNHQIDILDGFSTKQQSAKESLERIYSSGEELDILEITNYKNFIGKMVTDSKRQEMIIKKTRDMLRLKQLEVTEALKEVKMLEKLKETQEKNFYKHIEYVQAKEIDDIASTRYNRKNAA